MEKTIPTYEDYYNFVVSNLCNYLPDEDKEKILSFVKENESQVRKGYERRLEVIKQTGSIDDFFATDGGVAYSLNLMYE